MGVLKPIGEEKSDSLECSKPPTAQETTSSDSKPFIAECDGKRNQDFEGVTAKSISDKARDGDFFYVLKLKEVLQKYDPSAANILDLKDMATLWNATCEHSRRKLIHWVAHHKQMEILKWILDTPHVTDGIKFSSQKDFINCQDIYGYTALHLAIQANDKGSHVGIIRVLLQHPDIDVTIAAQNMRACKENESRSNGLTPLHFAARKGSLTMVKMLFKSNKLKDKDICATSASLKTVLHYAVEGGNSRVISYLLEVLKEQKTDYIVNACDVYRQTPLYLAASCKNVDVVEILLREGGGVIKLNTVTWEGMTALDAVKIKESQRMANLQQDFKGWDVVKRFKAYFQSLQQDFKGLDTVKRFNAYFQSVEEEEKNKQRIVEMIESYDVNWLQSERSKYANAANCLLVGAALIAGITYAGWLQPPLGLTQYYEFPTSDAPPDTFEYYAGVKDHWEMQLFWFFNSMSFFCSVATFIIGADAGIPDKCASLRTEVVQLRNSVVWASIILSVAILFVIGAFASAGIMVLPPIQRERAPMYVTVAIGMTLCLALLIKFTRKLKRWFLSPSLQYKLEIKRPSDGGSDGSKDEDIQQNAGMNSADPLAKSNAKLLHDHSNVASQPPKDWIQICLYEEHKPSEENKNLEEENKNLEEENQNLEEENKNLEEDNKNLEEENKALLLTQPARKKKRRGIKKRQAEQRRKARLAEEQMQKAPAEEQRLKVIAEGPSSLHFNSDSSSCDEDDLTQISEYVHRPTNEQRRKGSSKLSRVLRNRGQHMHDSNPGHP